MPDAATTRHAEIQPQICANPDDIWFDWLRRVRHGDDAPYANKLQLQLDAIRDRLLRYAALGPNQRIVDIGSGDGLVAFEVLKRESTTNVTFVDISPALVAYTQELAQQRGIVSRCRFVVASAESLANIPDASVDRVTVRAVIAYLSDKPAAIREFRRILRPGGRISIVDPIFSDQAFRLAGIARELRAGNTGAATSYFDYLHRCGCVHLPDTLEGIRANPLTNYTERDLVQMFETAGFINIRLRLYIDSIPPIAMPWHVYLGTSPRAGVPTIQEILNTRFNEKERGEFASLFRAGVEAGTGVERNVNAYVYADNV